MAFRKILPGFIFLLCVGSGHLLNAQELELPRKSPKASVSYTLGLTEVEINYSSPAVDGRTIWGELVPFNEIWRAGANEATTISLSTDVILEGKELAKGTYAFFLIPKPGDEAWTVILNKDTTLWGAHGYDPAKDVLRLDITPKMLEGNAERLTYTIHDQDMNQGYIKLAWENMRLYLRFFTNAMEKAMYNIEYALANTDMDKHWIIYAQGAAFLKDADTELYKALDWAERSTEMHPHSWNYFVLAEVHAALEQYNDAVLAAMKSKETGMANTQDQFYQAEKDIIERKLREWQSKI